MTDHAVVQEEMIEILSVDLLDQNRALVEELRRFARSIRLEFGWHYLLDITWILSNLGAVESKHIMDAGAGFGIIQWYLASKGAQVISVDRVSRNSLGLRFRSRFRARGIRATDLQPSLNVLKNRFSQKVDGPQHRRWLVKIVSPVRELSDYLHPPQGSGQVLIYNQDLSNLVHIQDGSLDAVVSVSSLEHNSQSGLEQVVGEIMRVLKPGGVLLATLEAARDEDWWHEASSGWCYTEASLRRLFDLPPGVPSNCNRYDELFEALRNNEELRENLASFYFKSDKNGMPRGVWDPKYQPVGVCKIKSQ
jgi:SAM-dependent methyltransferase